MPYFLVSEKHGKRCGVVEGENAADALYWYCEGGDDFHDMVEEAGGFNAWAEEMLATMYDCTEIHRSLILEYVERRLDGDETISIQL